MDDHAPAPVAASQTLSREEIEALVVAWYHKLDIHAPAEDLLPLVAPEGLEMRFPEGLIKGADGFRRWYDGVIQIFFDEQHTVTRVDISRQAGRTLVEVVVNWQARRWHPPAPRSEWLGFDAYQQWEMIRSPASGRPVILRYVVQELKPMPGSTPL